MNRYNDPSPPVSPPATGPSFFCPMCGVEEPDTIVLGVNREVLGCDHCLWIMDANEYSWERKNGW